MSTIDCPEAVNGLPEVPDPARGEVDRELAAMDTQITDAYRQFADRKEQIARDPGLAENAVLGPLRGKRAASLDRIGIAIGRVAQRPEGLESLAGCSLRADDGQGQDQGGNGPEPADFVDIRSVRPDADRPRKRRGASRGSFTTDCGRNENGKFNPDNVIVAPGVSNGAHHMHDYVGNQANDAFASDDDLADGATTCRNQGDRSTYYWPVLRLQNGQDEDDVDADGGGRDQNTGEIQTPSQVTLKFVGSPVGRVTAMPRFLRIITGDAKAFTNGDANANASWSCTGFEDRQAEGQVPDLSPGQSGGAYVRLPELLGRAEHRQRQPPQPCGVRPGRRAVPERVPGGAAAGAAHRLRRSAWSGLRRRLLPRAAAQADHRSR